MNTTNSSLYLTTNEWLLINRITKIYDNSNINYDKTRLNNYSLSETKLTDFLNDEQEIYQSLIKFYKQIEEFQEIKLEDKILLIKCNLTHLIHIHHILRDNFIENPKIGLYMSKWISSDFHHQMSKVRHSYDYFIQNPAILKLALVSFMFTINLSRLPLRQLSYRLFDSNLIIKHQNFYIELLWKYLNTLCEEKEAIKSIEILVFQYLRYQLLMEQMENIIKQQTNSNQFCPLTKSVLRLI
ncbi:hypothetical protein I4U23_017406 [Adineta vaga]|nr:hypothetical protein I4U23_017406 [Adineta vaga]